MDTTQLPILENTARDVIAELQRIPEFADTKICIIGGMAVVHYLPAYRLTNDVDFLVTAAGAPAAIKIRLQSLHDFDWPADMFYHTANSRRIQVDMLPIEVAPYKPPALRVISTVQLNEIPYVGFQDLLAFKIWSSGMRNDLAKRPKDASDAKELIQHAVSTGQLQFSQQQMEAIEIALPGLLQQSDEDEAWWRTQLGL